VHQNWVVGGFNNGLVETVVWPGVGERVGLFERGIGLGDAMEVQRSGPLCGQVGGLAFQLLPYLEQVIQSARVAGKHLQ